MVFWLSSIAQVTENRSKLREAVMHDDFIGRKNVLLRRECGMRDVRNAESMDGFLKDLTQTYNSHNIFLQYFSTIFFY